MSTFAIKSIPQLEKHLIYGGSFSDILNSLDISTEAVAEYCNWNTLEASRMCLFQSDCYQLELVCWEFGQRTPIHHYPKLESWMYVVEGTLVEENYTLPSNGTPYHKTVLETGEKRYRNTYMGLQRLVNKHPGRSISLHLYNGTVEHWQVLNAKGTELITAARPMLELNTL